jgi:putative ABC transport system permease protein
MPNKALSPMWAKAPLVHLHFPRLLLSIAFGALLLALATAAYPLFISSRTTDFVMAAIEDPLVTRAGAGIEYRIENLAPHRSRFPSPAVIGARFEDTMAGEPLFGPVVAGSLGPELSISVPANESTSASGRLFTATGAFRNVRLLEGVGEAGVWLSDLTASQLGVTPGDRIALSFEGRRPVEVTVAAIYRALYVEPRTAFWHWWDHDIYQLCQDCDPPPPFVLVSPDEFSRLSMGMGSPPVTLSWQAPVVPDRPITLDDALALERFTDRFRGEIGDQRNELSRIFPCCHGPLFAGSATTSLSSSMANVLAQSEGKTAALEHPGRLLQIAGIIVALAVLAAAGAFAATARNVEQRLLFSKGTGLSVVAAKACLEVAIPAGLGGAVGLGMAFLLVRTVRASAPIGASPSRQAVAGAALAILVSVLMLGAVSAVDFLRGSEHHRERLATLAQVPWELILVALAVHAFRRLQTGGAFVEDASSHVRSPSISLLLFPLLSIAGLAIIGVRVLVAGLRWLRERSGRFASWLYLAIHRLAGGSRMTLLLVAASALCLGIFAQTQTIVRSLQITVDAKAKLFVGSDVAGQVPYDTPLPERFTLPITRVTRLQQPGTLVPGGEDFDLLAVDAATLSSTAYWNPSFSDLSIQQMARRLAEPAGDAIRVVVAGAVTGGSPLAMDFDGRAVPVDIVARAQAFPGMTSLRPLVVVDADALRVAFAGLPNPLHYSPGASTEFWVKGEPSRASAALRGLRYPPYSILTADQVKDIPEFDAAIGSFLVLNGLGLSAALLVVLGMLMYLQARQRSQVVSYGLSLRMGMSHSAHRRSLTAELGAMLCCSYAIGLALALGAAFLILPLLDPLATIPPPPLYVLPLRVMGSAFVGVLAASWIGGWLTNRRAGAVRLGEVMRVAD